MDCVAPSAVFSISRCGGWPVMPQRQICSTAKPSQVRNMEPTLCMLRTLSSTTAIGSFCCALNSSTEARLNSSNFNLRNAKNVVS